MSLKEVARKFFTGSEIEECVDASYVSPMQTKEREIKEKIMYYLENRYDFTQREFADAKNYPPGYDKDENEFMDREMAFRLKIDFPSYRGENLYEYMQILVDEAMSKEFGNFYQRKIIFPWTGK